MVMVLAFAVYAPNLTNEFAMDDAYNVQSNERLRDLSRVHEFFITAWGGHAGGYETRINSNYYRPLSELSFALDYALYGLEPAGFHLTNNLLHAAASVLVLILCVYLGVEQRSSLFAAALFAVHPVHSEAVNLVTYRTELLTSLCALLGLLAYLGMSASWRRTWLVTLFYAIGLLCKETIVTLPAWLMILEFRRTRRVRDLLTFATPFALVLMGYFLIRLTLLAPSEVRFFNQEGTLLAGSVMAIYATYVRLLFIPWPLSPFYDWGILPPAASWLELSVSVGVALYLCSLALGVGCWRRRPIVAAGTWWWLIGLIPFFHIIPLPVGAAERFLYMPSVGAAVVVGGLGPMVLERVSSRAALLCCAVIIVALGSLTVLRTFDWKDDETLLMATMNDFPDAVNAPMALGELYCARGDLPSAHRAFTETDRRIPAFVPNIERWTDCLKTHGRIKEAHDVLATAKTRRPDPEWSAVESKLRSSR